MSKITNTIINTIKSLSHDDAQITEHLGASGREAKALGLQTQLLKNRYVLRQLALKTYGTVVLGKPEFLGYFAKLGAVPYKGNNKWLLRLVSGINQSAYAALNGDTVPSAAVVALHDYLLAVHAKTLNEQVFLTDLDKAILTILPDKPKQVAKPKNALADAIGLVCADMAALSVDQVLQIFHAVMTRMPSGADIAAAKAAKQGGAVTA